MGMKRTGIAMLQGLTLKRAKSQKGAVIIEFALVLPVFLLLLFGMVTFSLALYNKTVLTMATREGARTGVLFVADQDEDDKIELANTTALQVCQNNLVTFGGGAPSISSTISGDVLTVTATSNFTALYIFPDLVLAAETSMRVE